MYGEDALLVADTFNRSRCTVKYLGDGEGSGGLASQTITRRLLPGHLKRLVRDEQFSYEVWRQEAGAWSLAHRASPGSFDESDLLGDGEMLGEGGEGDEGPGVMAALHVGKDEAGQTSVGLAYVDVLQGIMGVAQFTDHAEALGNAEAALLQLGAAECIAVGSHTGLERMLARAGVARAPRSASDFSTASLGPDVDRLLATDAHRVPAHMLPELQLAQGAAALAGLLRGADLVADLTSHGRFRLSSFAPLDGVMRLDASACAALNLLPSASDASRQASLFGRLNSCRSPMGSRLLMAWLRQPLLDPTLIGRRHDMVGALVADAGLRAALQQQLLRGLPDVPRLALRLQREQAGLPEVVKLYQACQALPGLLEGLEGAQAEEAQVLREAYGAQTAQLVADFGNLTAMVEATLDLEALQSERAYRLRPSFDERLQELHGQLQAQMKVLRAEERRGQGWVKRCELEERSREGWVLRVPKSQQRAVEEAAKKDKTTVEEAGASKSAWYFRTHRMGGASQAHGRLQREYDEVQKELVTQLLGVVRGYGPALERLSALLSELDVYAALAVAAVSGPQPWVRPSLSPAGTGDTELRGCRHPCLEGGAAGGGDEHHHQAYIANNVLFRRKTRELAIVTGPNMGGKSTYIRSAGMTVLLAQMGSFVPCSAALVSPCDAILCRVGAADSQVRGVSTFMAEMLEMAHVLRSATDRSLLIVDELGRGTSTYDGFGLAWAMAEHVACNVGAFSFFATHFHELTELASARPNVYNLHVSARTDHDALVLLYAVREGACDQSFGLHVAELARFPPRVLQMAARKARQLEGNTHSAESAGESHSKRPRLNVDDQRLLADFVEQARAANGNLDTVRQLLADPALKALAQGNN